MTIRKNPILSVDLIVKDPHGRILLGEVTEKWQEAGRYLWGLPGREVSLGENLKARAERNLREEVGMEMVSGRIVAVNSNFGYGNHYVAVGILIEARGNPINRQPQDWIQWKWFDKADIPSRLFPSAELTLKTFFEGVLSLDFK